MEFEEVYVRNLGRSRGLAYGILGDWELAEDAVQEAAIKAVKAWGKQEIKNADAWFIVVVRNSCFRFWHSRNSKPIPVEFGGEGDHEEIMERKLKSPDSASPYRAACKSELCDVVYVIMGKMNPLYRQSLELHYIHGYKVKEIADMMNATMGTINRRLSRGRDDFRKAALRVGIDVMDFV